MSHGNHHNGVEVKHLQRLLQEREAEHKDCLLSLSSQLSLLRSSVTEAAVFVEQGNTGEAALALGQLYKDCADLNDRILAVANNTARNY